MFIKKNNESTLKSPDWQVAAEPPYCHSNPVPIWGKIYFRACKKEILRRFAPQNDI